MGFFDDLFDNVKDVAEGVFDKGIKPAVEEFYETHKRELEKAATDVTQFGEKVMEEWQKQNQAVLGVVLKVASDAVTTIAKPVDEGLNQYLGIDIQLKPLVEQAQIETAKALQKLAEGGKDDDPVIALARKLVLEAVQQIESKGPEALDKVDKMIFGPSGLKDVVDATIKAQK